MKRSSLYLVAFVSALALAACGSESSTTEAPASSSAEAEQHTGDHGSAGSNTGQGRGVIRSVGVQGDFLTIEHGPLEGIAMGAMTMGFDITGGVDLSGFADGDEVAFAVKRGRDNSYRITAICNTTTKGDDCLSKQ